MLYVVSFSLIHKYYICTNTLSIPLSLSSLNLPLLYVYLPCTFHYRIFPSSLYFWIQFWKCIYSTCFLSFLSTCSIIFWVFPPRSIFIYLWIKTASDIFNWWCFAFGLFLMFAYLYSTVFVSSLHFHSTRSLRKSAWPPPQKHVYF